jgi:hypothetical protein
LPITFLPPCYDEFTGGNYLRYMYNLISDDMDFFNSPTVTYFYNLKF